MLQADIFDKKFQFLEKLYSYFWMNAPSVSILLYVVFVENIPKRSTQ